MKLAKRCIWLMCLLGPNWSLAQREPAQLAVRVADRFLADRNQFADTADVWGNYTLDITVEAIIAYMLHMEDRRYEEAVRRFFAFRGYRASDTISYRKHPFCHPYYAHFELSRDSAFVAPFVHESRRMQRALRRSPEGAIQINHQGGHYLLIDYVQEYASRMARAGALSGDTTFFRECVEQFERYRELLRDEESGLYSQGRGWLPDSLALSPACWSRGQGWLFRGMVSALQYLPAGSVYERRLLVLTRELADALLAVQDEQGLWHTLPCLPAEQSQPETSGTGMIAYHLALAHCKGYLPDSTYRQAAEEAFRGLRAYVSPEGDVLGTSKGPGPLRSVEEYRGRGEKNEPHAFQAFIYAFTGAALLKDCP